jgi:Fur family transcriptional regulator, ferric uptake regulator
MHQDFQSILREAGQSVTRPRQAVFETLAHADEPLKNGEIAKRTPTVDRASVYRTLELFTKLGITTTTIRGWTPFTELAAPFKPHHHHMICEQCGRVEEIASDTLEDVLSLVATRHQFSLKSHTVELSGLCSTCLNLPQPAAS